MGMEDMAKMIVKKLGGEKCRFRRELFSNVGSLKWWGDNRIAMDVIYRKLLREA
jgi:hypothetical protein